MRVKELINQLKKLPQEYPVLFKCIHDNQKGHEVYSINFCDLFEKGFLNKGKRYPIVLLSTQNNDEIKRIQGIKK